jgi:transposase InsO family protein
MPWKSGTIMDNRLEFVRLAQAGGVSVAELCRRFGISRETGFQYLRRYRAEGEAGLKDRSRRPHSSPRQTPEAMETRILGLREVHPWGGRKLARRLQDLGVAGVPAVSTVTEVLRRHGKLDPAEAVKHQPFTRFERSAPNELWQMDFKGHVAMGHARCHPLTVLDDHSRYSLGLIACADETDDTVRQHLTAVFRRYGLPEAMLSDNGSPWGGSGSRGYTAFEVWLMRLGIRLHHGRPYHPQTQGKDERFHRSLKVEVLQMRPRSDLVTYQAAFDHWRPIYNEQRPHEGIGMAVPASRYKPSQTPFTEPLAEPEYYASDVVRRVDKDGAAQFHTRRIKMSQAFAGMQVGFRPTATDGVWQVFFARFVIAEVDLRNNQTNIVTVRYVSERTSGLTPV